MEGQWSAADTLSAAVRTRVDLGCVQLASPSLGK